MFKDRAAGEGVLEHLECCLCLLSPMECGPFLGKGNQGGDRPWVNQYETSIDVRKPEKGMEFFDVSGGFSILDRRHLPFFHCDSFLRVDQAFFWLEMHAGISNFLLDCPDVCAMFVKGV